MAKRSRPRTLRTGTARRPRARRAKTAAAAPHPAPGDVEVGPTKSNTRRGSVQQESAEPRAAPSKSAARSAAETVLRASRNNLGAAPAVVMKAASILEEEIAMGLGAVKRLEQRFVDVDAIRKQGPDAVMSRFRHDAHDAVDIILDVLTAAAQTVAAQGVRFMNVTAGAAVPNADNETAPAGVHLPALRVPGKVSAGGTVQVAMLLENPSDAATAVFTLHASDLVSASGGHISSRQVGFSPPSLSVGPRQTGRVDVSVSVPGNTPVGTYEGLVRASQIENLRAILSVVVD